MFTLRKVGGALVVVFPPRLDTHECTTWQADLLVQIAKEQEGPIVFDLVGVAFVSSLFVRVCLAAYKQAGPKRFRLTNLSPEVKKVFKIAGLDQLLAAG